MPFERPTLKELKDRVRADLAATLGEPIPQKSVLANIGDVVAGASHGQYGFAEWISRQIFPDTADGEYLDRIAAIWGLSRKPAGVSAGSVVMTGTPGSNIPAGWLLTYNSVQFETTQSKAIEVGGSVSVPVEAMVAGTVGNVAAGMVMSLANPLAGVDPSATVGAGGIVGGSDIETDEALRGRILLKIQEPPHGGSADDYVRWALEVPGVTRAWCLPGYMGTGTVGVTFVMDGSVDIIPTPEKVLEVEEYIDVLRPVTAELYVFAPTPVAVDFEITLTPNTVAVQEAVQQALADYINDNGFPGATLFKSQLSEVVSTSPGEISHVMSEPASDVVVGPGQIATMGTITWL